MNLLQKFYFKVYLVNHQAFPIQIHINLYVHNINLKLAMVFLANAAGLIYPFAHDILYSPI